MPHKTFSVGGGLDLVTPDDRLSPGAAREMLNFEVSAEGGHRRIAGYERFSGQPYPSQAAAIVLRFVLAPTGGAVGDTLVGVTSGATGIICDITGVEVAVADTVGAFQVGEVVQVSASNVGTVAAFGTLDFSTLRQARLRNRAYDARRNLISGVPGSGPVSVGSLNGVVYAWRANSAGQTLRMHKQSPTGWQEVPLGSELRFNTGTVTIVPGDVITDATSGATATVKRVLLQTGSWGAGTAAGFLIVGNRVGDFAAGNVINLASGAAAVAASGADVIRLEPGGKVRTVVGSIFGGVDGKRMYGCDGVNRMFEFDGEIYAPIEISHPSVTPSCLAIFKSRVLVGYKSSLLVSSPGTPYQWAPLTDGGEIALSGNCTDIVPQAATESAGAVFVATDNKGHILYASGLVSTWQLDPGNAFSKASANTAQTMDRTYLLCDNGVTSVSATQNYGNFSGATLSSGIAPWIAAHRNRATAAGVHRTKNQYRVFYSDGSGLYFTILNGKFLGVGPVQFPDAFWTVCECEDAFGGISLFAGSMNSGQVFRLDAGASFDGSPIEFLHVSPATGLGDTRLRKRFTRSALDIGDVSYVKFKIGYDVDVRDRSRTTAGELQDLARNASLYAWDTMAWDQFVWDGHDLTQSVVDTPGRGVTIAMRVQGIQEVVEPFVINNITIHYEPLREARS